MSEQKEKSQYELFRENPIVKWTIEATGIEKAIDISGMRPFTQGMKRRLEKEFNVRFSPAGLSSADEETKLLFFILREFDKTLTLEDVDDMPVPLAQRVSIFCGERTIEIDSPTLARSIPSPAPTDGGKENLTNSPQPN